MKTTFKNLLFFSLFAGGTLFAQSENESAAAKEFDKKFKKYTENNETENAKTSLKLAKDWIDLASENPETKDNAKTQYYKAFIYLELANQEKSKEYQDIAYKYLALAFNNPVDKYKEKIQQYIDQKSNTVFNNGVNAFNEKKYDAAPFLFLESIEIKQVLGQNMPDALKYALQAFKKALSDFRVEKKSEESQKLIEQMLTKLPTNRDVLIIVLGDQLEIKNLETYEKYTETFVKTYPTDTINKTLYYNLATVQLEKLEFEKAETNYKKALKLHGMYVDAIYQLAVTYITWSTTKSKEADKLQSKDPKYKALYEESNKLLAKGASALEKYVSVETTDRAALITLSNAHSNLGNTQKALDYKAKADAIK